MPYVRDLIKSYTLDSVVWEFSWGITNNPQLSEFDSEYITEKYRNIFHDPEFIVDNSHDSLLKGSFLEIRIDEVHKKLLPDDKSPKIQQKVDGFQESFPRSQDYLDRRLYRTPEGIQNLIIEKSKLQNKCLISINSNSILFDCNYEQLTLILEILEHSIQFYPLAIINNKPIYSNQIILPNFAMHSYLFSFNLGSDIMELIGDQIDLQHTNSDKLFPYLELISEEIFNSSSRLQNRLKQLNFSNLLGYSGIYVSLIPNSKTSKLGKFDEGRIFFYVSEEFTRNSLMLDRAAIMRSSLVLLSYILSIYSKNSTDSDNGKFDELLKDISVYTTSE
ncbi:MAG: hypothetical protein GPJ54_14970 [Candidatus Heimdallarchaeota archaeon]|nr:hypothetical protein [Candidatus Heimdallarchaeota archaeon]